MAKRPANTEAYENTDPPLVPHHVFSESVRILQSLSPRHALADRDNMIWHIPQTLWLWTNWAPWKHIPAINAFLGLTLRASTFYWPGPVSRPLWVRGVRNCLTHCIYKLLITVNISQLYLDKQAVECLCL